MFNINPDKSMIDDIIKQLREYNGKPVTLMEVCGTHTAAVFKHGIRDILPENIKLVSGPGCPVCVTPGSYIDSAINIAKDDKTIVTAFGDMLRVPGASTTLLKERARGADIRVVYSPMDCLAIANANPDKNVVFLGVGFETTIPVIALAILEAAGSNIKNFKVLNQVKTMPSVLKLLVSDSELKINGFLYPGHVSAISGISEYKKIAEVYDIGGVVTGFEPADILMAVKLLIRMAYRKPAQVVNLYPWVVKDEGNCKALDKINEVFEECDSIWRGFGTIKASGLKIREKYALYDAANFYEIPEIIEDSNKACLCGEVLKGKVTPKGCGLFGKVCTPEKPSGPCMVSSEGTCAAYYSRYRQDIANK